MDTCNAWMCDATHMHESRHAHTHVCVMTHIGCTLAYAGVASYPHILHTHASWHIPGVPGHMYESRDTRDMAKTGCTSAGARVTFIHTHKSRLYTHRSHVIHTRKSRHTLFVLEEVSHDTHCLCLRRLPVCSILMHQCLRWWLNSWSFLALWPSIFWFMLLYVDRM